MLHAAPSGAATRSRPRNEARRPRLNRITNRLGLIDRHGGLTKFRPALLLVEAGQVDAAHELMPNLAVVGVSQALTRIDAERIAAAGFERGPNGVEKGGTVYLWLRFGNRSTVDRDRIRNALAARLLAAGVADVLIVPHEGDDEQPAALLDRLGPTRAGLRLKALLREAEWAGAFDPANEYDARNRWTVAA